MIKKTAVDLLIQELCMNNMVQLKFSQWKQFDVICKRAKRFEKNQIETAVIDCYEHISSFADKHIPMTFTPTEYYNANYNEVINDSTN